MCYYISMQSVENIIINHMVVFCTYFTMNMKDFSLKQYYDVNLTISRSQYGRFSISGLA